MGKKERRPDEREEPAEPPAELKEGSVSLPEGDPEEETRKSNLASDNTREEDVLTPTNPFSDGFDDDDDHFLKSLEISADGPTTLAADRSMASTPTLIVISTNGISSSTDSVDEQNPKCPPLKPPRILLRSESDSNDDDSIAETHSPKRILSVDKSLLADLKVIREIDPCWVLNIDADAFLESR